MLRKMLVTTSCLALLLDAGARLSASPILLPGGSITVPGPSSTGVSFTFAGTLTQNDTLALTQTGDPCLQSPPAYCTNGAGVVTVAGTSPVGAATTFTGPIGGTTGTWDYGALLIEISGAGTVQIFPANPSNGLGSPSPPVSLTLASTSLSALGFAPFNQVNPTVTFIMADTLYTDNSGQFVLTQVPEPATGGMVGLLACALVGWVRRRR
jgi:PEP-CTERM motif